MPNIKQISAVVLALSFLFAPASAHPGKTDSKGGHHVGGTNEYHYHHGYPAHQHTNGKCPYDFDDQTGSQSGNSSSSNSSKVTPRSPTPSEKPTRSSEPSPIAIIVLLIIGGMFLCSLGFTVFINIWGAIHDKHKRKLEEKATKEKFEAEREKYLALYGHTAPEILAGMPTSMEIGTDGLPKMKGAPGWGPELTFYASRSGNRFHKKLGCSGAYFPVHALRVSSFYLCSRCASQVQIPDLSWYYEYVKIRRIKEQYNIP